MSLFNQGLSGQPLVMKRRRKSVGQFKKSNPEWQAIQRASTNVAITLLNANTWPLSDADKFVAKEVLDILLWKYSEPGKSKPSHYMMNPLWSEGSVTSLEKHGFSTSKKRIGKDALRFDHIVPLKILKRSILSGKHPRRAFIRRVFELSIGAVVTDREHASLGQVDKEHRDISFQEFRNNPLFRYQKEKIHLRFNPKCPTSVKRCLVKLLKMNQPSA